MKVNVIFLGLAISVISVASQASDKRSCKKYAEVVAVNAMNKSLIADNKKNHQEDPEVPKDLPKEDYASLQQTVFLDKNDEETQEDTGVYGVEMGVMEECLDGLKIETNVVIKKSKASCEVIKISKYGDRDCG